MSNRYVSLFQIMKDTSNYMCLYRSKLNSKLLEEHIDNIRYILF